MEFIPARKSWPTALAVLLNLTKVLATLLLGEQGKYRHQKKQQWYITITTKEYDPQFKNNKTRRKERGGLPFIHPANLQWLCFRQCNGCIYYKLNFYCIIYSKIDSHAINTSNTGKNTSNSFIHMSKYTWHWHLHIHTFSIICHKYIQHWHLYIHRNLNCF